MQTTQAKAKPTIDDLSNVQRLVHLGMRADSVYVDAIRADLTRARLRAYNDEIGIQARRAGCSGQGTLTSGPVLTELDSLSKEDAAAYARQYNDDLTKAIIKIGTDTPRANRNVYAAKLTAWEGERSQSKASLLAQWTENTARILAQEHFVKNNNLDGFAHLEPTEASCDVCQGWVNRGIVPLKVALNNPGVWHYGCPHLWVTEPEKVDDCTELWTG